MTRSTTGPAMPGPAGTPELQPFDARFRGDWQWIQPARFRPRWELRCGDAPVATLGAGGSLFGPGVATFAHEAWEFRMRFPGGIAVKRAGEAEPWGLYRPGWLSGGRFERAGESALLWRRQDFWMRRWAFLSEEQQPLVRFVVRPSFLRSNASLEFEDAARTLPDLPVLLALGWILVLHSRRGHSGYR